MADQKIYNIFISHCWDYDDDYDRVVRMLNEATEKYYFNYKNYSVPKKDPLSASTDIGLKRALRDQISPASIVIILAGMYAHHSDWIQNEIDIALDMDKPIIGVEPWGQQRTPIAVKDIAREIIGWNTYSILSAVRKHSL